MNSSTKEQLLGEALTQVLIAAGVLHKDAEPTGPELLTAAHDFVASKADGSKNRIVVLMNGGLIENIISETPMEFLKIEEADSMDDPQDLTDIYDNGNPLYVSRIEAECLPDNVGDHFQKFEEALAKKEEENISPGM